MEKARGRPRETSSGRDVLRVRECPRGVLRTFAGHKSAILGTGLTDTYTQPSSTCRIVLAPCTFFLFLALSFFPPASSLSVLCVSHQASLWRASTHAAHVQRHRMEAFLTTNLEREKERERERERESRARCTGRTKIREQRKRADTP